MVACCSKESYILILTAGAHVKSAGSRTWLAERIWGCSIPRAWSLWFTSSTHSKVRMRRSTLPSAYTAAQSQDGNSVQCEGRGRLTSILSASMMHQMLRMEAPTWGHCLLQSISTIVFQSKRHVGTPGDDSRTRSSHIQHPEEGDDVVAIAMPCKWLVSIASSSEHSTTNDVEPERSSVDRRKLKKLSQKGERGTPLLPFKRHGFCTVRDTRQTEMSVAPHRGGIGSVGSCWTLLHHIVLMNGNVTE